VSNMAIISCAVIQTDPQPDLISNVAVVEDSNYTWLQEIWSDFFPNQRLQWIDELEKAPWENELTPIWSGWAMNEEGYWYNTTPEPTEVANEE
jgi:hypothetical protein